MIERKQMYIAKCDKCDEIFGDGEIEFCYDEKQDLIDELDDALWVKEGRKIICNECFVKKYK